MGDRATGGKDGTRAKYTKLPSMIARRAWRKLMSTEGLDTIRGVGGCYLFTRAAGCLKG